MPAQSKFHASRGIITFLNNKFKYYLASNRACKSMYGLYAGEGIRVYTGIIFHIFRTSQRYPVNPRLYTWKKFI